MSEQHRLACESKYWRSFAREHGRRAWEETKGRIKKHRGKSGLNRLLAEMNKNV